MGNKRLRLGRVNPNIIDPPTNDQLKQQEIQAMLEQDTQRGFGVTEMTPTVAMFPR